MFASVIHRVWTESQMQMGLILFKIIVSHIQKMTGFTQMLMFSWSWYWSVHSLILELHDFFKYLWKHVGFLCVVSKYEVLDLYPSADEYNSRTWFWPSYKPIMVHLFNFNITEGRYFAKTDNKLLLSKHAFPHNQVKKLTTLAYFIVTCCDNF